MHDNRHSQRDNMAMLYESSDYAEFEDERTLAKVPNFMSIGKVDSINYYGHQAKQRYQSVTNESMESVQNRSLKRSAPSDIKQSSQPFVERSRLISADYTPANQEMNRHAFSGLKRSYLDRKDH